MGDHRADIKLEMTAHGKTYKHEMYINYFDNGSGCDDRIIEWFAQSWADAMSRYDAQMAEYYESERKAKEDEADRREYARLQAKFKTQERP